LEEGRDDVPGDVVLQSWDDEVRRDGAMFRVQVQEAKVPSGDRLEFIEVARNLPVRLRDLAEDFPQRLHLLAEFPHLVLTIAFAHARSLSRRRALNPYFLSD